MHRYALAVRTASYLDRLLELVGLSRARSLDLALRCAHAVLALLFSAAMALPRRVETAQRIGGTARARSGALSSRGCCVRDGGRYALHLVCRMPHGA